MLPVSVALHGFNIITRQRDDLSSGHIWAQR
jgi:hypothetical protein